MATTSGNTGESPLVITECQIEVREILERLRALGETTAMEEWSSAIAQQYRMVLDNMAALEAYLEVYKLSTMGNGHGNGGHSAQKPPGP